MADRNVLLAERLNQVVVDAMRDFARSSELRSRDYDQGKKLCNRIVNGVRGRAHGWCVDFRGSADSLVYAGLAYAEWFKGVGECKVIDFSGRNIELYRPCGEREFALSIEYTDSELDHLHAAYRSKRSGRSADAAKRISAAEKISKAQRALWANPEYRARVCASMRAAWRRRKAGSAGA